jgi:hypothetical protein
MVECDIGQKEKIQILLAEYSSLRSEINARVSSVYSCISVLIFLIVFVLQQPGGRNFYAGIFIAVLGAAICGRFLAYDSFSAARRVREIETAINEKAKENLLVWESKRGGLTAGHWLGAMMVWRRSN